MKITSVDSSKEKIGTLINAGSDINLGPSVLTIGGLQYTTESTLVVAMPALAESERYQVYAVQIAGVVSLVISQNENSVGPSGYNTWKLVGSFYSSVGSNFLQFANIKTKPFEDIEEAIDLDGNADFTTGEITVTRNGNQINIQTTRDLVFPSQSTAASTIGILPLWATPLQDQFNIYVNNGPSNIARANARNNRGFNVDFSNFDGSNSNETTDFGWAQLDYRVPGNTDKRNIEDL